MEAQLKQLDCRLKVLEEERALLIHKPHTIQTVADILEQDLNLEARKKAELLAYLLYKHVHTSEPVKPNRYSDDDLWILRAAIMRVNGGADLPAPDRLSYEDWIRLCTEACL